MWACANRKQSIMEIALSCGFGSSAYFSSVFRRHLHCSPSEYRDAKSPASNKMTK
jgi:AraC-like DNA-binding protein